MRRNTDRVICSSFDLSDKRAGIFMSGLTSDGIYASSFGDIDLVVVVALPLLDVGAFLTPTAGPDFFFFADCLLFDPNALEEFSNRDKAALPALAADTEFVLLSFFAPPNEEVEFCCRCVSVIKLSSMACWSAISSVGNDDGVGLDVAAEPEVDGVVVVALVVCS